MPVVVDISEKKKKSNFLSWSNIFNKWLAPNYAVDHKQKKSRAISLCPVFLLYFLNQKKKLFKNLTGQSHAFGNRIQSCKYF